MERNHSWESNRRLSFWRNSQQFMWAECSLPCPQEPADCPYRQSDESSHSSSSILILSWNILLDLLSDLYPSRFPAKTSYEHLFSPMRAICHAHFIPFDIIIWFISDLEV
jgi:hypothetical protein